MAIKIIKVNKAASKPPNRAAILPPTMSLAVQTISFIFSIPFKRISPYIRLAVSCKGLMILATKKDSLLKLSEGIVLPCAHDLSVTVLIGTWTAGGAS